MKTADLFFRKRDESSNSALEMQAADWLVQRQAGLTADQHARLAVWIALSKHHAGAFAKIEAAWTQLNHPRVIGQAENIREILALRAQRRTRRAWSLSVAVMALAAIALLSSVPQPAPVTTSVRPTVATIAPRPDLRTLPDGSEMELNATTEFEIDYTPAERTVRLTQGDAIFTVRHDPARPFVVVAGKVRIRAVGTRFLVRHQPERIDVLVTEGTVGVGRNLPLAEAGSELLLTAGRQAEVPSSEDLEASQLKVSSASANDIARELAWRDKRVEFTGTPLPEALNWFNRQNHTQIVIANPALQARQVSGICWADDPAEFARLLEAGLGVKVESSGATITLR